MGRSRSRSRSRGRRRSYSRSYSRSPSPDDNCRVHVADLGIDPSRSEIVKCFEKFGRIVDMWLARNPPCFAFIVYNYRDEAERAIKEMDGKALCGGRIRVSFARPRTRGRKRRGFDPNLRCYQCGEKGHFSRDCDDVWHSRKRRSPSRSRSRSRDRHSRRRSRRSRSRDRSRSRSRSGSQSKSSRKKSSSDSKSSRKRTHSSRSTRSRSPKKSKSKDSKSPKKTSKERKSDNEEKEPEDKSKEKRKSKSRSKSPSPSQKPLSREASPVTEENGEVNSNSGSPGDVGESITDPSGGRWASNSPLPKGNAEGDQQDTDLSEGKWADSPQGKSVDPSEGRWANSPSPDSRQTGGGSDKE